MNILERTSSFDIIRYFIPYSKADKLYYSPVHHFLQKIKNVRLACVKHLNSVQSEPSSNSSVKFSLFSKKKEKVLFNY